MPNAVDPEYALPVRAPTGWRAPVPRPWHKAAFLGRLRAACGHVVAVVPCLGLVLGLWQREILCARASLRLLQVWDDGEHQPQSTAPSSAMA